LDGTVSTLATDNAKLQTSLTQAEARLAEFYADQARMDQELGVRHELAEKLRGQLRELEKEKRDLTRRYNEQVRFNR
jgi:chromosome segregation ATPase